jgi:hypothetical protein
MMVTEYKLILVTCHFIRVLPAYYASVCVQPDWGYFEWTEQIITINPYELIQTFFAMILNNLLIFFKI